MGFHCVSLASQQMLEIILYLMQLCAVVILYYMKKGYLVSLNATKKMLAKNYRVMFFLTTNSVDFNCYA